MVVVRKPGVPCSVWLPDGEAEKGLVDLVDGLAVCVEKIGFHSVGTKEKGDLSASLFKFLYGSNLI